MNEYAVTEIEYRGEKYTAAVLAEDGKICELALRKADDRSRTGSIYKALIEKSAGSIGGAFALIDGKERVFIPSAGIKHIHASQPALVEIKADEVSGKCAVASTKTEIAGRYAVVFADEGGVSFSGKLTDVQKDIIRSWLKDHSLKRKILVRTNAARAEKSEFLREVEELTAKMDAVLEAYKSASTGELLYSPDPFYLTLLRDLYARPDRVSCDIPAAAALMDGFLGRAYPDETFDPSFSERDGGLTIAERLNIIDELDKLSGRRIWLKSGAFLIIEKTEAFSVIDVNSGRAAGRRKPEETYREVNIEAAAEICRQIRLRNLSGIIMVDFINMKNEDHRIELINVMKKLVRGDHAGTEVVDLTPLGIMEIVRKRTSKSLAEVIGVC